MNAKEIYIEIKEDAKINKHRLDDECAKQAILYSKWSKRLSNAEANLTRKELELTQFKAKTMLREKESKKTDKAAESAYRMSSTYGQINKQVVSLKKVVDLMQAGVYTMMQRKSMLDCLVKLKCADYFSD
jgi:hypothetical protein